MSQNDTLLYLINYLRSENSRYADIEIPDAEPERFRLYRSLVNIRPAAPAPEEYYKAEDEYLRCAAAGKGITDIAELTPREPHIYLWRGDITTLKCGAIVNAANSGMTGCYSPCHSCIDNCIHTFAGTRLRLECDRIMREQGHPEPTGTAKLTPAYDLPCEYIIHTVGPIVQGALTDRHCRLLRSCYESCLAIAAEHNVGSIAFCCISTGVFGFPQQEAAEIAVDAVRAYLKKNTLDVIFNVFSQADLNIYDALL